MGNLALILGSSVLALFMAEMIFRAIQPEADPEYHVKQTANQYDFYRFDEKLGWSNAPFMEGEYRRREFSYHISINEYGMRQGAVDKTPAKGIFRIAFLGDSFVWGIGASDQERFPDIIGKLAGVETLNFGVSGYAPVQYVLQLDDVITFKPDMVIVAITSNDFDENVLYRRWGYYKPYFALNEDGNIELKGYPLKNTKQFGSKQARPKHEILEWSLIARTIQYYINQRMADDQQQGLTAFHSIYLSKNAPKHVLEARDQAILINKIILERMKIKLDKEGIPMVIIFSPSKSEYMVNGRYGTPGINPEVADIIENTARELGVDFINRIQRLNLEDFWKYDGHWNPGGHFKMAKAVHEYLVDKGYVDKHSNLLPNKRMPVINDLFYGVGH
jgi:hypothetical protein